MAEAATDVDLGGDTCLLVGQEGSQVRLKVSLAILKHASPYFNTLFGPGFKEGADVTAGKDIEMQGDDTDAFVLLCKILHMRFDLPESKSPLCADELLDFAIVVDKYDCTKAVALVLKPIFPEPPQHTQTFFNVAKLALAAYLLDDPHLFKQLTECLALHFVDDFSNFMTLPCGQHVPAVAWGKVLLGYYSLHGTLTLAFVLEHMRSKAKSELAENVTSSLSRCLNLDCTDCNKLYAKVVKMLMASEVLPLRSNTESVFRIATKLRNLPPPEGAARHYRPCQGHRSSDISPDRFAEVATQVLQRCNGLCLDCATSGRRNEVKRCHVPGHCS